MPRRGSGKKYVQRDSIRDNPDISREIRYVLVCADYIKPKFLAIPAWLIAAGALGLNLAELRNLTGLGLISCENTLEVLSRQDLAGRLEPNPTQGQKRWVALYPRGLDLGIEGKEEKEEKKSQYILPEGKYDTSSDCSILQPERNSEGRKRKRLAASCTGNNNDFAGLENNRGISPGESLTIAGSAPRVAKRRRKKLKAKQETKKPELVSGPVTKKTEGDSVRPSPRAALSTDLETETKARYGGRGYRNYLKNPSENPALLDWKLKPKPNRWGPLDWVGYWLHKWREFYGEEDPNFVDQTLHRTLSKSRERTKGGLDIYWQTAMKIERFRDSDRTFRGNGIQVKEFIDWLFETFLPDASWMNSPVSANQTFRVTDNYFLDKFKVRNIKSKSQEKKKGKWRPWGYDYGN